MGGSKGWEGGVQRQGLFDFSISLVSLGEYWQRAREREREHLFVMRGTIVISGPLT